MTTNYSLYKKLTSEFFGLEQVAAEMVPN